MLELICRLPLRQAKESLQNNTHFGVWPKCTFRNSRIGQNHCSKVVCVGEDRDGHAFAGGEPPALRVSAGEARMAIRHFPLFLARFWKRMRSDPTVMPDVFRHPLRGKITGVLNRGAVAPRTGPG
jgi:hypothetical protein